MAINTRCLILRSKCCARGIELTRPVGNDPTFLSKYWWDVVHRKIFRNMRSNTCLSHLGCFRPAIVFVVQSDSRSPEPPSRLPKHSTSLQLLSGIFGFCFLLSCVRSALLRESTGPVLGGWCSAPRGLINT